MKFYTIDRALAEAIEAGDNAARINIEFVRGLEIQAVDERDILQADFFSIREVGGGTTARGEILLDNTEGRYSTVDAGQCAGMEARVSFTIGEGLPSFHRWTLYVNEKGLQDVRGEGRTRYVLLVLRDRSEQLRKSDEQKDWTEDVSFAYVTVCDKTTPERSLLHLIARRAGLSVSDIDCCTIPLTLPFVRLTKNLWSELSALATAYRCHLESAIEKPLVFAHSPYQSEPLVDDEVSYTFYGTDIFYLRLTAKAGHYRNSVRLKINMPVSLAKQEIWRYADQPVLYTSAMEAYYPFREHSLREIEHEGYEARYTVVDMNGKIRPVIYADEVDTQEEAQARLHAQCGAIAYSMYDVSSHHDKALVTLNAGGYVDLISASIHGRPIVLDLNRSHFESDSGQIARYGTVALHITGSYFSDDSINGLPHYVDWVKRELRERLHHKREYTIKTHRALFHARVGAKIKTITRDGERTGVITSLTMHYKKGEAFIAILKCTEDTK